MVTGQMASSLMSRDYANIIIINIIYTSAHNLDSPLRVNILQNISYLTNGVHPKINPHTEIQIYIIMKWKLWVVLFEIYKTNILSFFILSCKNGRAAFVVQGSFNPHFVELTFYFSSYQNVQLCLRCFWLNVKLQNIWISIFGKAAFYF